MKALRNKVLPATAAAVIIAVFVAYVGLSAPFDSDIRGQDIEAYWNAAEALANGGDLYGRDSTSNAVYRYAPWFAAAWIPLTYLPRDLVEGVWLAVLLAAVAWLAYPLLRSFTGLLVAMLIVPQVLEYAWLGNVDALVLVALALHGRRGGPVLVGVAASLKIAPIAFVLPYVRAGAWAKAALALITAAILWAPAFLFDLSDWAVEPTLYSPMAESALAGVLWAGLLLTAGTLAFDRYPVFAAALIALALTIRLHLYSMGYLLVPSRTSVTGTARQHRAKA